MNRDPYFDKWLDLFYDLFVEMDKVNYSEEEEEIEPPSIQNLINSFINQVELIYPSKKEALTLNSKSTGSTYSSELELLDNLFNDKTRLESWRAFFVSDSFLDIQYEEAWGNALLHYLHSSKKLSNLPKSFLVQLYLSYFSREGSIFNTMSYSLVRSITYILASQPPNNLKYLFYNLFSDKFVESYITHDLYRGLLYVYNKEDMTDEWRIKGYNFYLKHIHYAVYPVVLKKREDEVILLVSYFIRKFKALYHQNYVKLVNNFDLTNLENRKERTLYTHLYNAILDTGFNFDKSESDDTIKKAFYNSSLPSALAQHAVKKDIDSFFEHPFFIEHAITLDFISELWHKISQDVLISYYCWERLFRFYTDAEIKLFVEDEFNWLHTGLSEICRLLNGSDFKQYAQLYNLKEDGSISLIDSFVESADSISEEMKEEWFRNRIFFNNLNLDTQTPMRTIYHSILLGLLESLVSNTGFAYDMEIDGRYIIDYKNDRVSAVFNTMEKDKDELYTIPICETATLSKKEYTEILEDVVNIYLEKYFNIASVKKQFTDLLKKAKNIIVQ